MIRAHTGQQPLRANFSWLRARRPPPDADQSPPGTTPSPPDADRSPPGGQRQSPCRGRPSQSSLNRLTTPSTTRARRHRLAIGCHRVASPDADRSPPGGTRYKPAASVKSRKQPKGAGHPVFWSEFALPAGASWPFGHSFRSMTRVVARFQVQHTSGTISSGHTQPVQWCVFKDLRSS